MFAEDLSFPTSIAPYRDGVIVAAPPEVVYLKDTDNDGRADKQTTFADGLHLPIVRLEKLEQEEVNSL